MNDYSESELLLECGTFVQHAAASRRTPKSAFADRPAQPPRSQSRLTPL